jgi:putative peptidoglycan lipid II flippase
MGKVSVAFSKVNTKLSIQLAATLLASSSLVAALLGFARDRLLNANYYHTYPVGIDAYTVAFTIPDFMFFVLVSGALSVTFIPVFNERLASGNRKSAWELSTSMINFMALITLVASVLIIIFADPLVRYIVGPGLDESGRNLAISMMRVIAINPFLFSIASVIASIQQAVGRFAFYALAPIIYNVGIIIGITVFTGGINLFGVQIFEGGIMGVALGVVLGSIMQLIVSSVGLIGLGLDYRFKIYWKNKGFRKVLRLLPARSFDQGIDYFNSLVEINLASRMVAGTIRAYQQATTLHMVPITLIGVAISTAAFPKMTERLSQGRPDLFRIELQTVLRVILWLALPVAAVAYLTRGYLVHFVVGIGDPLIAGIFGILTIAILFRSVYHIAARSFYAQQDTKTPLYVSLFTIGLNIFLAILFTMSLNMGAYGLAWAQSIVAAIEIFILFVIMQRRIPGLLNRDFAHAFVRMLSATGFSAVAAYFAVNTFSLNLTDQSFFVLFPKFMIIVIVSGLMYLAASKILNLREVDPIINKVKSLFFAQIKGKN